MSSKSRTGQCFHWSGLEGCWWASELLQWGGVTVCRIDACLFSVLGSRLTKRSVAMSEPASPARKYASASVAQTLKELPPPTIPTNLETRIPIHHNSHQISTTQAAAVTTRSSTRPQLPRNEGFAHRRARSLHAGVVLAEEVVAVVELYLAMAERPRAQPHDFLPIVRQVACAETSSERSE